MIELKDCPFCGQKAISELYYEKMGFWRVSCQYCGATGPYLERLNEEMAINAWNRRT